MIADIIASALIITGATFAFIAGIGVIRMPDIYMRMSATTKAGTMGIGLIVSGMIVFFADVDVAVRGLAIIVFGFLSAPVAAHMIARAAYFVGAPLWGGTVVDELAHRYHPTTHALGSAGRVEDEAGRTVSPGRTEM